MSLFASTFIVTALKTSNNQIIWVNPTPQSVRFCRPLRIAIEKETNEIIIRENNRLENEVGELQPHYFYLSNGKKVIVKFDVFLTMM